jgi:hypothetical protein
MLEPVAPDVLERAKIALHAYQCCIVHGISPSYPNGLLSDLVAELEAARTENERLKADCNRCDRICGEKK